MKKEYFNKYEYDRIIRTNTTDVLLANEMFEEYFQKYPEDYYGKMLYISNLIWVNELEKAEELLESISTKIDTVSRDEKKKEELLKQLSFCKIKVLCQTSRYEECIEYITSHKKELMAHNVNLGSTLIFLYNELGIKLAERSADNSYLINQIVDYQEDDFRKHISKHLTDFKDEDDEISSIFFYDFPFDKVIDEIKNMIPNEYKINYGIYNNIYHFRYDNNGKCIPKPNAYKDKEAKYVNKIADYFKVVTFKDSNKMITMCPCTNVRGLPYIDLNYLNSGNNKAKSKKISAIDKFNQKYNK